jgi:hypothetical protein
MVRRCAWLLVLLAVGCEKRGEQTEPATGGAVSRAAQGVGKGVERGARGVKQGAEKAAGGVKKGLEKGAQGLKKGADAVSKAVSGQ